MPLGGRLTDADCAALRAQLQTRVLALYDGEVAAQAALLLALAQIPS